MINLSMAADAERVEKVATTCAVIHKTSYLCKDVQQKKLKGLSAVTVLCYLFSISFQESLKIGT